MPEVNWDEFSPVDDSDVDWSQFESIEPEHRPVEQSWLEEYVVNPLRGGYYQGKRFVSESMREAGITDADPIEHQVRMDDLNRQSEKYNASIASMDALSRAGDAKTIGAFVDEVVANPQLVSNVTLSSLGMFAPVLAATAAASTVGGPVGTALVAGTGSAAIEYSATIVNKLDAKGLDSKDPVAWANALQDEAFMADARESGAKRGIAIGTFDAITAGLAGKLLSGAKPGIISPTVRAGGEAGLQSAGGMAGEATAQVWDEGKITSLGEIALEGIAEIPTAFVEVPGNIRAAARAATAKDPIEVADQVQSTETVDDALSSAQYLIDEVDVSQPAPVDVGMAMPQVEGTPPKDVMPIDKGEARIRAEEARIKTEAAFTEAESADYMKAAEQKREQEVDKAITEGVEIEERFQEEEAILERGRERVKSLRTAREKREAAIDKVLAKQPEVKGTQLGDALKAEMDKLAATEVMPEITPEAADIETTKKSAEAVVITEEKKRAQAKKHPGLKEGLAAEESHVTAQEAAPEGVAVTPVEQKEEKTTQAAPAEERIEVKEGKVGDKLGSGETRLTSSGRETTAFPKISTDTNRKTINTVKRVDGWLYENAVKEAKARGDDFNARIFEAENPSKMPPATKDAMEWYLFGDTLISKSVKKASPEESGKTKQSTEELDSAEEEAAVTAKPQDILGMTKNAYISKELRDDKIKKASPGYADARRRAEEQYENDLEKAEASLTFDEFNARNSDSPESLNRQAYDALREEHGIQDAKPKKAGPEKIETKPEVKPKEAAKTEAPKAEPQETAPQVVQKEEPRSVPKEELSKHQVMTGQKESGGVFANNRKAKVNADEAIRRIDANIDRHQRLITCLKT